MSGVTSKTQTDTLELINNELTALLARQSEAGAWIDTKAAALVGYVGAASAFLATRHSQPVLTVLAYAAYAAAAGFGISAYAVGAYSDVPNPVQLFNAYAERAKSDALAALAARRVRAFEKNVPKHKRKAAWWSVSLVALMLGVVLMLAAIFVQTG